MVLPEHSLCYCHKDLESTTDLEGLDVSKSGHYVTRSLMMLGTGRRAYRLHEHRTSPVKLKLAHKLITQCRCKGLQVCAVWDGVLNRSAARHQSPKLRICRVPERENTGSPRIAAPFFPFVGRVAVLTPKDTLKEAGVGAHEVSSGSANRPVSRSPM